MTARTGKVSFAAAFATRRKQWATCDELTATPCIFSQEEANNRPGHHGRCIRHGALLIPQPRYDGSRMAAMIVASSMAGAGGRSS